jgi:REP element-mobilizing transposase RayT
MGHDSDKHHRRSVRLKEYDYSQPWAYFVTICIRDRACLFGEIVDEVMRLNEAGHAAQQCWMDIPDHFPFPQVVLDEAIIMPNHIHGIIVIHRRGEASAIPPHVSEEQPRSDASPLRQRPNGTQPRSLSAIVQNFKSVSTRKMNAASGSPGTSVWQRGYYEHVVRNEDELKAIREYILGNPARWNEDENNPVQTDCGRSQTKATPWGT